MSRFMRAFEAVRSGKEKRVVVREQDIIDSVDVEVINFQPNVPTVLENSYKQKMEKYRHFQNTKLQIFC